MKPMETALLKAKEKAQKEFTTMIENHFERYSTAIKNKKLTIDMVEDFMGEAMSEGSRIIRESAGNAMKAAETEIVKKKELCPYCSNEIKKHSQRKIQIKTTNGEIAVERSYNRCKHCKYAEMPLDDALEITDLPYKMTKRCMVEVAYFGQNQVSFGAGSEMILKTMKMEINKETVREVTEHLGRIIYDEDTHRAAKLMEGMSFVEIFGKYKNKTLYIMTDGAAVNTRTEDKNGSTWKENKTVMVFTDKDLIRRKNESHIITRKEYAALIGSAEDFKKYVWDLAVRNGYGQVDRVVLIADGAAWIRNICAELFPDAIQILDLYHLKQNVYTYAKHKFKQDASKYVPWAESMNAKLEAGKAEEVLLELPENETLPANVVNLRTYLENNRNKINYPDYRKSGLFVGSGAIESANKIILQRRLKQSGMRWSVPGAQYILSLRCKVESGLWDKAALRFCA